MKFMVYLAFVAVLIEGAISGYQFKQITDSRAAGRAQNLAVWHQVLCASEIAILADQTVTAKQRVRAIAFYDGILAEIHAKPCH